MRNRNQIACVRTHFFTEVVYPEAIHVHKFALSHFDPPSFPGLLETAH